ncbi:MAG: hypothetical protein GXP21_02800 [Gammaproteobacteria bacterium]|nr:hypothetical protein [Gammaproteobacteria bacterium]
MARNNLTDDQINQLNSLLNKKAALLQSIINAGVTSGIRYQPITGEVHDSGDESVADTLVDTQICSQHHASNEIKEVHTALERIKHKHYGVCIDCGNPIDFSRLEAHPEAKRCITCKEQYERIASHSSSPYL